MGSSSAEMPCHRIGEYCEVFCNFNALFNYGDGLNVQSECGAEQVECWGGVQELYPKRGRIKKPN